MKSVGSCNSTRGNEIEKIIVEKYSGIAAGHAGYDAELGACLLEIKSCAEWHVSYSKGKLYRHKGRFLINTEKHEEFKKAADAAGKKAVYAFVKIPRYDDGRLENDPSSWIEVWAKWEDVDRLVKNSASRRITKNRWHGSDITRYYYCVALKHIFGV